jgi:hypothetical protein
MIFLRKEGNVFPYIGGVSSFTFWNCRHAWRQVYTVWDNFTQFAKKVSNTTQCKKYWFLRWHIAKIYLRWDQINVRFPDTDKYQIFLAELDPDLNQLDPDFFVQMRNLGRTVVLRCAIFSASQSIWKSLIITVNAFASQRVRPLSNELTFNALELIIKHFLSPYFYLNNCLNNSIFSQQAIFSRKFNILFFDKCSNINKIRF